MSDSPPEATEPRIVHDCGRSPEPQQYGLLGRIAVALFPFAAGRSLHLARLSAIRRACQALGVAEPAEAAAAIRCGATYPMLADAASMARQTAWKRYRPARNPD